MRTPATRIATLTGGCQCGKVRYALYVQPQKVALCHCRMCQRAVGAPFGVFAVVPRTDFTWTQGQPQSWQSSNRAFREFCADCGTPLAFRPLDLDIMEMMVGSLDDPARATPTYEVGREGRLPWIDALPGLTGKTTVENMGPERAASVISFQSQAD